MCDKLYLSQFVHSAVYKGTYQAVSCLSLRKKYIQPLLTSGRNFQQLLKIQENICDVTTARINLLPQLKELKENMIIFYFCGCNDNN
jgi:hypothetical protein